MSDIISIMSDIVLNNVGHQRNHLPRAFLHALSISLRKPNRKHFSANKPLFSTYRKPNTASLPPLYRKPENPAAQGENFVGIS